LIARLAALVPKPRLNLTRFHGVLAPNSKYRARVTLARRGKGGQPAATDNVDEPTLAENRAAITWAQRLKRVFGIDVETCPACGGGCGSSPAFRARRHRENLYVIWIRKHLTPPVPDCRLPGHLPSEDCLIDREELTGDSAAR
jgi:hypothetical protein